MVLRNIKKKCEEKALNIAQLEKLADISPRTIYNWDDVMPAADKLDRVADVLGTTVKALLYGEEEGGKSA